MAPTETIILEIGSGIPGLGIALITGWLVGTLMARRQYGVVMPLGLLLAAVALLPWWVRLVISFFLPLLSGYTWLFAWWRASQPAHDQAPSHQPRSRDVAAALPGWNPEEIDRPTSMDAGMAHRPSLVQQGQKQSSLEAHVIERKPSKSGKRKEDAAPPDHLQVMGARHAKSMIAIGPDPGLELKGESCE